MNNNRQKKETFNKEAEEKKLKETFKNNFNKLLKEKGFTQTKFAEYSKISTGSISKFAKGESIPKKSILEIIAKSLDVDSDYLIGKNQCPNYSCEDINKKLGLSQKAIEELYKMQHDYGIFDENVADIDITEERKIRNTYSKKLQILSSIIEESAELFWVLDAIEKYDLEKEKLSKTEDIIAKFDLKESLDDWEGKIQRRFLKLVKEIL